MPIIKRLFVIAERNKTEKLCLELKEKGAHFENVILAQGTARSNLLEVLGLDSSEKVLITASIMPDKVDGLMRMLEANFKFGNGGGIAFTVPMTAVSSPAALMLLSGGLIK